MFVGNSNASKRHFTMSANTQITMGWVLRLADKSDLTGFPKVFWKAIFECFDWNEHLNPLEKISKENLDAHSVVFAFCILFVLLYWYNYWQNFYWYLQTGWSDEFGNLWLASQVLLRHLLFSRRHKQYISFFEISQYFYLAFYKKSGQI